MAQPVVQFLSTEDWEFVVSAKDATGAPFDLSGYDLECQFRESPRAPLIAGVPGNNCLIALDEDDNSKIWVTVLAEGRTWCSTKNTYVYGDMMAVRIVDGVKRILAVGRIPFMVLQGFTHV